VFVKTFSSTVLPFFSFVVVSLFSPDDESELIHDNCNVCVPRVFPFSTAVSAERLSL